MQGGHVHIRFSWQEKGPVRCRTAAGLAQLPLLPVQKHLVVFEHLVVADVLKPAGAESDQQSR